MIWAHRRECHLFKMKNFGPSAFVILEAAAIGIFGFGVTTWSLKWAAVGLVLCGAFGLLLNRSAAT